MMVATIDLELCNGCGICVNSCPCDVIRMVDKKNKKATIKYPEDCMLCELCAKDCPTKAIKVSPVKPQQLLLSWG